MQQGYSGSLCRDRLFVNNNKLHTTNAPWSMSIKVARVSDVFITVCPNYVLLFVDLSTEREKASVLLHDAQMKKIKCFITSSFSVSQSRPDNSRYKVYALMWQGYHGHSPYFWYPSARYKARLVSSSLLFGSTLTHQNANHSLNKLGWYLTIAYHKDTIRYNKKTTANSS